MPERDFELYLSLLSRFLRLKAAQRDEIADELRDHLEARLEELAARGLSRDEAIKAALDEFGDAAELAQHFTHVAHVRKRRIIMRYTFGTAAALAAAILITTAFWPESKQAPVGVMAVVEAQDPGKGAAPSTKLPLAGGAADNSDKAVVEAMLSRRLEHLEFIDAPLRDALEYLSEKLGVDIIIDRSNLSDEGINLEAQVNVQIRRTSISGRAALDLVLEPAKLSYTFRDGLIMVTTPQNANQIQVYNVRDLVRQAHDSYGGSGMPMGGAPGMMGPGGSMGPHSGMSPMGRSGGMMMAGMAAGGGAHAEGSAGIGGMGGGGMGGGVAIRETNSLAELIATTIDPASWDGEGGHGSIIQYQELLVVKNSQTVHGKIRALLEMMRETAQRPPGSTAGASPGMGMPAGGPGGGPGAIPPGAPSKR